MNELRQRYDELHVQNIHLIHDTLRHPDTIYANYPRIMDTMYEMEVVVNEMLETVALSNQAPSEIQALRDELLHRLRRIQQDYNGLKTNTDKLETLRRIRAFQDESWKTPLTTYLIVFFVLVVLVFFAILFMRQRDKTTINPTMVTTRPAFT